MEPDQSRLDGSPLSFVWVFFESPRDVDAAASVLALLEVRSGVVTSVRALGETGCTPVEVEAGRVTLAPLCQVV
jgi:hypothetical protein